MVGVRCHQRLLVSIPLARGLVRSSQKRVMIPFLSWLNLGRTLQHIALQTLPCDSTFDLVVFDVGNSQGQYPPGQQRGIS